MRERSRPPARSTTCSRSSSTLAVACAFVALESSTKSTPPMLATSSTRCGRFVQPSRVVAISAGRAPTVTAAAVAARALSTSCDARNAGSRYDEAAGPGDRGVAHDEVSVVTPLGARDRPARCRCRELPRHRVVGVHDERLCGVLVGEHACLRRRVRLDAAVPVDVVLRDVEEHGYVRSERPGGERELERRDLGHDDVDVVGRGVDERPADVADRDAREPRRRAHRRDHRGHRGLAVGSGDRDDPGRSDTLAEPFDREVDLRAHRNARGERRRGRRVIGRHPGARHQQLRRARERRGLLRRRRLDHLGTERTRSPRTSRVGVADRTVLEHRDVVTVCTRVVDDRRAGAREPDHEHPHQSIAPGMLMKSA